MIFRLQSIRRLCQNEMRTQNRRNVREFTLIASAIKIYQQQAAEENNQNHVITRIFKDFDELNLRILCNTTEMWEAHEERMFREIMKKEQCSELEAIKIIHRIFFETTDRLKKSMVLQRAGLCMVSVAGIGCIPLVFDKSTALWVNSNWVGLPVEEDIDTALAVGAWTWNWMEPVMGTFTFVLLAAQVAKQFMKNLGMHPYKEYMRHKRVQAIQKEFPQFDPVITRSFVRCIDTQTIKWLRYY